MANVGIKESVLKLSSDADAYPGRISVECIKIVGGASGMSVKIHADGSSSGAVLYEGTVGNSSEKVDLVEFHSSSGVYLEVVAGSGSVYIYTDPGC